MVTGLSQFLDRDEGNGGTLLVDDMSGTLARLASKKEVASRRAGMTDQGNAIGLMESRVIDRPLLGRDSVRGIEGRELAFHQTPRIRIQRKSCPRSFTADGKLDHMAPTNSL